MIIDDPMYINKYLFIAVENSTCPVNTKIMEINKYRMEPGKARRPKHLFVQNQMFL